jgi:uncharacterized small protein (DUF1192 family)
MLTDRLEQRRYDVAQLMDRIVVIQHEIADLAERLRIERVRITNEKLARANP